MEAVFLKILNMSLTAGWLVLAVLAVRLLLKKAPKWIAVLLWGLVGFRLLCPFSLESMFSLIPNAEPVPNSILYADKPMIQSGVTVLNSAVNPILADTFAPEIGASVNPMQVAVFVSSVVWLVGMFTMVLYAVISFARIRKRVNEATVLRDNIFLCDRIDTPFILGLVRPKIYIPSAMDAQDLQYVTAHEKAHLQRHDHWWKPLGFLLLTVHWFNPLLWVAYILLCRDIELACDEKVISGMGTESKKPYSTALINCSVPRKAVVACPLAFGEVGVKARVKSVLHYKKPTVWILVLALIASLVVAIFFLPNPATSIPEDLSAFLYEQIIEYHHGGYKSGAFWCADMEILGVQNEKDITTVYMWVLYSEYDKVDGVIEDVSGAHIPTVLTVQKTEDGYNLLSYWEPRDGSLYASDIREKFPWYLHSKAIDSQQFIQKQREACDRAAEQYFASFPEEETVTVGQLIPGLTFRTNWCLYMNPLSSSLSMDGDNGYRYVIGEKSFLVYRKDDGNVIYGTSSPVLENEYGVLQDEITMSDWEWQDFPYTNEQWNALFKPADGFGAVSDIGSYYEEILYRPLNDEMFLLCVNPGDIWLVELRSNAQMGTYVWSIHSLIPENTQTD